MFVADCLVRVALAFPIFRVSNHPFTLGQLRKRKSIKSILSKHTVFLQRFQKFSACRPNFYTCSLTHNKNMPTTSVPHHPREKGESFLVVFDFDDTCCLGNSDEEIPKYLGEAEAFAAINHVPRRVQWTNAISKIIGPYTREQITEAVPHAVVVPEATREVFRYLHSLTEGPNPRVEIAVASDANVLFIEESFKQVIRIPTPPIYSNGFVDLRETPEGPQTCPETGRTIYSKLTWQSPNSHDCERCRACPNMCKSAIVQQALAASKLRDPTVIFVGDGFNDSCPMQRVLRLRDHMFCRMGFSLEKILMNEAERKGVCTHHTWYDATELKALVEAVVGRPRLPPTVLFANEGGSDDEFRTVSLLKRMPEIVSRLVKEAKEAEAADAAAGRDTASTYAGLITTLEELSTDISEGKEGILTKAGGIVSRPEFLPIPQFLLNYGSSWRDLPWLQGEIYFNVLLWHIVYHYTPAVPTAAKALDTAAAAAGARLTVDAFRSWGVAGEAACLGQPVADLKGALPAYDMYLAEKTSVTESFFFSHIKPMVAQAEAFAAANTSGAQSAAGAKAEIHRLLSACVWGNTVDLSMFNRAELEAMSTQVGSPTAGHAADHHLLDKKVVANDMADAAEYLLSRLQHYAGKTTEAKEGPAAVDIVMDNMGVECAADMALGLVLTALCPALNVRYHTKPIPYYVSDVMPADIERMLGYWEREEATAAAAKRFRAALASGAIEVHTHPYWVHPSEFREMPSSLVNTYFFAKRFAASAESSSPAAAGVAVKKHQTRNFGIVDEFIVPKSDLVIFKGDLNFRRVCGDRHFSADMFFLKSYADQALPNDRSVPFAEAVAYWPHAVVPMLALRTNKSEVCVGPSLEAMQRLDEETKRAWRCNGQYAVANFAN